MSEESILFLILLALIAIIIVVAICAWVVIDFILGLFNAPFAVKLAAWFLFMLLYFRGSGSRSESD
ncbi:hypothetical protein DRJ16_04265 [Candidatus Woesearchaeota archaeon]|nr:MAG: hypothetical protein DRJ16_04265 [Candidatus Woesearchaeota archaeon]